ncbi:exonuclease VII small subunit [Bifidobacterium gallicum DSM 20093 = LMG 11596]|nr:exodeoxyribonuclease VII small subunit [Bifidobacterium gallicum]KFI57684.1 exonuclease VII small subunit [Bifidobacterium gallicum DSM 20093 = LMG 11596]
MSAKKETVEIEVEATAEPVAETAGAEEPQVASSLTEQERADIAAMTYEQARDQLIQAVQALETGGLSLEQSMRQWEIGEALAERAQTLLGQVRAKLDAAQQRQAQTAQMAGTQSNLE